MAVNHPDGLYTCARHLLTLKFDFQVEIEGTLGFSDGPTVPRVERDRWPRFCVSRLMIHLADAFHFSAANW
jgi:hypothetical protein